MSFLTGISLEEVLVVGVVILLFFSLVISNPPTSQEIEQI